MPGESHTPNKTRAIFKEIAKCGQQVLGFIYLKPSLDSLSITAYINAINNSIHKCFYVMTHENDHVLPNFEQKIW